MRAFSDTRRLILYQSPQVPTLPHQRIRQPVPPCLPLRRGLILFCSVVRIFEEMKFVCFETAFVHFLLQGEANPREGEVVVSTRGAGGWGGEEVQPYAARGPLCFCLRLR